MSFSSLGSQNKPSKKPARLIAWFFIEPNIPILLRINGVLDFVHRPEFQITSEHSVSENESVAVFRCGE
jgi:hypothetical protein